MGTEKTENLIVLMDKQRPACRKIRRRAFVCLIPTPKQGASGGAGTLPRISIPTPKQDAMVRSGVGVGAFISIPTPN